MKCPMNEEPLNLIPREWRAEGLRRAVPAGSGYTIPEGSELCPACRFVFKELMTQYGGDFAKVIEHIRVNRLIFSEKDRVGIGTFQPKDEKNQDSTELTGDINYRKIAEYGSRLRPAGLQLRRRVQHRQPRHHRVRRGAEARRRVPLRPAGRLAGAQDQAEEVPPDGHRRGHHRAHQRARVQEAPEQRVHGGAARPHGEDRHPVHHQARRGGEDLREGLQLPRTSRASTSPRTRWRWPRCGRC